MRASTTAAILGPLSVVAVGFGAWGIGAQLDNQESQAVATSNAAAEQITEDQDFRHRIDAINQTLSGSGSGTGDSAPNGDQLAQEANAEGRLIDRGEPGHAQQAAMHFGQYRDSYPGIADPSDLIRDGRAGEGMTPGMTYYVDHLSGMGEESCTLSFVASDPSGEDTVLTAGHCMVSVQKQVTFPDGDMENIVPLGEFIGGKSNDGSIDSGFSGDTDYAAISLDSSVNGTRLIGDEYRVVDMLGVDDLHPGMEVCKVGGRTGETCGPLIASNDTMARANIFTQPGDSGSPVFVKLGGSDVAAVGLVSSSPNGANGEDVGTVTDFALVQPIADFHGLSLTFE